MQGRMHRSCCDKAAAEHRPVLCTLILTSPRLPGNRLACRPVGARDPPRIAERLLVVVWLVSGASPVWFCVRLAAAIDTPASSF